MGEPSSISEIYAEISMDSMAYLLRSETPEGMVVFGCSEPGCSRIQDMQYVEHSTSLDTEVVQGFQRYL